MAFIRTQKLVRSDNGRIKSGSAEIIDVQYVKNARFHSKQVVRERLGRIVFLSEDKKDGIFLSPTRGLVEYNALTDAFSNVDRDDYLPLTKFQCLSLLFPYFCPDFFL